MITTLKKVLFVLMILYSALTVYLYVIDYFVITTELDNEIYYAEKITNKNETLLSLIKEEKEKIKIKDKYVILFSITTLAYSLFNYPYQQRRN